MFVAYLFFIAVTNLVWFCMDLLHAVDLFVMHVDVTALSVKRSSSPVQTVTAPTTVTKSAVATKPIPAPKPREDSESVVKYDTTVRQADVG